MKKLALSALLAGLAAVTCLAGEVIPVNTANSSLILSTDDDGLLYFSHYGGPVSDPSVFLSSRTYVNLGYGRQYLAYPAAGGRNICGEAICATSGDGGINTELEYVSHEFTDGDDVSETRILLRDPKSGLEVPFLQGLQGRGRDSLPQRDRQQRTQETYSPLLLFQLYAYPCGKVSAVPLQRQLGKGDAV